MAFTDSSHSQKQHIVLKDLQNELTCAATAMAVMKMPSTPNGVKKVCKLRVSRNGTGSLRSRIPLQAQHVASDIGRIKLFIAQPTEQRKDYSF